MFIIVCFVASAIIKCEIPNFFALIFAAVTIQKNFRLDFLSLAGATKQIDVNKS